MDQQSSTSKVTVEYFDPHNVYKLLAPGLAPRLPLHNLHWQSHAGPLRSIDTLHVELVHAGKDGSTAAATPSATATPSDSAPRDDGFQTQQVGGSSDATEAAEAPSVPNKAAGGQRRHQIPGLRRTPYLKLLLVRCDDNDSYKTSVRSEVREWIKSQTPSSSSSSKKGSQEEKHDAYEWLIVHVVIPNTAAATQPRGAAKSEGGASDKSATSRWRTGSTPLMEKFRSDFNSTSKGSPDRIAQIRIGINDVPYDLLPRVVPAVPSGYSESEKDAGMAWDDLISKLKNLILASFDLRVSQYEEDIKEKDGQRSLPGWNFCTFFILKEGLARGFENVGLVEDALVGYDELSVGLDSVIHEQAESASPESHGGSLLSFTQDLKELAQRKIAEATGGTHEKDEVVDLQSKETAENKVDDIPISSTRKAYRDMILANKVSVFDFRCYIFSRQIALLLRQGNAACSREELLDKLKLQEESNYHGVKTLTKPSKIDTEPENLTVLAEVCTRTLQFIPSMSQIMRQDIISAMLKKTGSEDKAENARMDPLLEEIVDNLIATFAFSVAQQILAQTATHALPIPPSSLSLGDVQEPKSSIPEPKTMMHPARSSSLHGRPPPGPPSPGMFPGPGRRASVAATTEIQNNNFLKAGIEQLSAKRAELYMLSRSVLDGLGRKRQWSTGWNEAPNVEMDGEDDLEDVSLEETSPQSSVSGEASDRTSIAPSASGLCSHVLRTAVDDVEGFYRLYEILTDKAMRHFTVANHEHAVRASMADLAVLKFYLKEYRQAQMLFPKTIPSYGTEGWSSLELSMLVMYSHCLSELQYKEEYVSVALTLLEKACGSEKSRLLANPASLRGQQTPVTDKSPLKGVLERLLTLASSLTTEVKVPLTNFFTDVELVGDPEYKDRQDQYGLSVQLRSLLPEELGLDGVQMRAVCLNEGSQQELVFEKNSDTLVKPGVNTVQLSCSSMIPGTYSVHRLDLLSKNMRLYYERDIHEVPLATTPIFKQPTVTLFQRAGPLDVFLRASKHTVLDRDNSLDLELTTGWNDLQSCELRVKPASGGLRLLTTEAKIVESTAEFAQAAEAGIFHFGELSPDTTLTLRFPFSTEQDVNDVLAKVEVVYVTKAGESFSLAKSLRVPVSLAVGVSVQDVFKHQALFSRFNVSTATPSPIRLYKSELEESDQFESAFGAAPTNTVMVFPKQPACLLYKITRKKGSKPAKRPGRTMHLKLYYSVLQNEVENAIRNSISDSMKGTPLEPYIKAVLAGVDDEVRNILTAQDLERVGLVGSLTTSVLQEASWSQHFDRLGRIPGTGDSVSEKATEFLQDWQRANPRIVIDSSATEEPRSIVIPVEVPSISIVHTADIRLEKPIPGPLGNASGSAPTVSVNQMLTATLHLKWTRVWDTDTAQGEDQEFSYEVTAPADTWLLGGRRRGHFIIPGGPGATSSTAETEAEIPLILIPLHEGWLPFPSVEIKMIPADGEVGGVNEGAVASTSACEVDWRNLGETVRVVSERRGVTLSLDASGPGGGPLVLGSEGMERHQGRIVA